MGDPNTPGPGWYAAPHANGDPRYWDGSRWHEAPIPQDSVAVPAPPGSAARVAGSDGRNVVAIIAFVVAVIGFVFACIPGALIVGWILLPIAFVLALVSLFVKGRGKAFGVTGLIVSIVGTVVGVVVFMIVVGSAFTSAFGGEDTVLIEGSAAPTDAGDRQDAGAQEGTRSSPYPLGATVAADEWQVTIDSVAFAANDAVAAENQFNDEPEPGMEYILVHATITYVGDDEEEGGIPAFVSIAYVTPTGETIDAPVGVVAPDRMDSLAVLYNGGSVSGNVVLEVPSEGARDGVLAVRPGMLADKVFFAVS